MFMVFSSQVHTENVLQHMWEQCESEQFCDVVLILGTDGIRVPAHRAVLSTSSDYFKTMFNSSMSESVSKEVKLSAGGGEMLKSLIKFCYTGYIEIKEDLAVELFEMAHYFYLEFVVNACAIFLTKMLKPTNCLGLALLAERYDCQSLLTEAIEYSFRHFSEVNKTDEFLNLNAQLLGQLLASDKLCVSTEEDVYESLMRWIQHDPATREKDKCELLKFVRLSLLEPSFLFNHLKLNASLESQVFLEAVECQLLPESRTLHAAILSKRRTPDPILIAITKSNPEICIHYYCPKQLTWIKWLKQLPYCSNFAVAVMRNKMYIIGGVENADEYLNNTICLNFKTMIMEEVNPMRESRARFCVAVLNGFLYALGGWNNSYLNSVEKWDSETNTWINVASMIVNRIEFGIAICNKNLYVVGGRSISGVLRSAEYYDPHQNKWTAIEPMRHARSNHAVTVANGLLYAVGGTETKTAEFYDPSTKKWTRICCLSTKLDSPKSCVTFNDKVIVFHKDRVEEYDPVTNKWEVNTSLMGLNDIDDIFSYSGELLSGFATAE